MMPKLFSTDLKVPHLFSWDQIGRDYHAKKRENFKIFIIICRLCFRKTNKTIRTHFSYLTVGLKFEAALYN